MGWGHRELSSTSKRVFGFSSPFSFFFLTNSSLIPVLAGSTAARSREQSINEPIRRVAAVVAVGRRTKTLSSSASLRRDPSPFGRPTKPNTRQKRQNWPPSRARHTHTHSHTPHDRTHAPSLGRRAGNPVFGRAETFPVENASPARGEPPPTNKQKKVFRSHRRKREAATDAKRDEHEGRKTPEIAAGGSKEECGIVCGGDGRAIE